MIARRVWRIGVLTLFRNDDGYFVRCTNRTYDHTHPVPPDKVERWKRLVLTGR